MAAFTIDSTKPLSGQIIATVVALRKAQDLVNNLAPVIAEMDQAQVDQYIVFTGATQAQIQTTFDDIATLLNTSTDLKNLTEKVIW